MHKKCPKTLLCHCDPDMGREKQSLAKIRLLRRPPQAEAGRSTPRKDNYWILFFSVCVKSKIVWKNIDSNFNLGAC